MRACSTCLHQRNYGTDNNSLLWRCARAQLEEDLVTGAPRTVACVCCCLRCGCRTHRPQQVSPCPELQAANLPLLDPLCVEPNPRLPYDPDQAVAALNQQVRWLWARIKELEARHG